MAITVAKSMIGALGDLADCNKTPYDVISGEGKEIRDRYGPHYGWRKYRRQAVGCRCHRSPDLNADEPAGSLATMVLPELRALANRAGVKGTSGMRKNELIAAIEEIRRQANGAPAVDRSAQEHDKGDRPPSSEAPATQGEQTPTEQIDSQSQQVRPERRSATREAGPSGSGERAGTAADDTDNRQGGQQDAKTEERGTDAGGDQGVTSRLRAVSRRAATRTEKRVRAGADAGSAIGGAAVNDPATAPRLNCVRTTSSSR